MIEQINNYSGVIAHTYRKSTKQLRGNLINSHQPKMYLNNVSVTLILNNQKLQLSLKILNSAKEYLVE